MYKNSHLQEHYRNLLGIIETSNNLHGTLTNIAVCFTHVYNLKPLFQLTILKKVLLTSQLVIDMIFSREG